MTADFNAQESIDRLRTVVKQAATESTLRVLVVEDDEADAYLLIDILNRFRVTSVWKRGGQEALDEIANNGFKVVFLDLKLPGFDGIDVVRKLREVDSDACLVVVTGWATEAVRAALQHMGTVVLVEKPATVEKIGFVLGLAAHKQRA